MNGEEIKLAANSCDDDCVLTLFDLLGCINEIWILYFKNECTQLGNIS